MTKETLHTFDRAYEPAPILQQVAAKLAIGSKLPQPVAKIGLWGIDEKT